MEEEEHACSSCCIICCDDAEKEETDSVCPMCKECDVKDKLSELKSNISTCVDTLNKSGENKKRLENLLSHIDKVINLTREYKTEGLVSPSMEKFIETCKEVKKKMEDNVSSDPPCGECKEPPECTCNKANLASSAASSKCVDPTCPTNMPTEPPCDVCKKPPECTCNKANLESSAGSSKCADPTCPTNIPTEPTCDVCKKSPECTCNKANLESSASSSKCVDPTCPTDMPIEESPCSDSTYNLTDVSCNKIGYFEKKFKEIVKITRFKNEDGSISEEKQVITIKTETRNPNQTKGLDGKNDENEQCCDFSGSEGKGLVENKSSSNICKPKPRETKSEHATGSQQTCEAKFRACMSASQSKEIMNKDSNASKNSCGPCNPATEDLKGPLVECIKGCPNQTTSLQSSTASKSAIPVYKKASKSKTGKTVSVKKPEKDKSNCGLPCPSDDKANQKTTISTEALWRDVWTSTTDLLCVPSCTPNKKVNSCPRCMGKDHKTEPSTNCCTIPRTIANTKPNKAKDASKGCPKCTGIERKSNPSSSCCTIPSSIANMKPNLTKDASIGCPQCTGKERKAESCSSHCTNSCSTPNTKPNCPRCMGKDHKTEPSSSCYTIPSSIANTKTNSANGVSKGCPKFMGKERKPEPSSSCCTVKIISKPAKTCCSQKKEKPNQDPQELVLSILDTIKKTYIPSNSALSKDKLQNICKSCKSKQGEEEEQESEILSTSGNSSYMSMSCKSVGVGSAESNVGKCSVCSKSSTPSIKSQKHTCCSSRRNSEESSGETRCKIAQTTSKSACCSPKKPSTTSCRPKKSTGSMKCKPTCVTIKDVGTTTRRSTRFDVRPVTRPPTPKKTNLNECTCHSESHFQRNKGQREPARSSMSYDDEYFCKW